MKKFLERIVVFFVAVAIIDIVFGKCCDYMYEHSKSGDTGRINYAIRECNSDVLIMGSSRAYHHYNPQILSDSLDLAVYNIGINGSGVILMDGLYRLISQRYNPKYIIYELTAEFDIYHYTGDANNTRYLAQLKPYYKEECLKQLFDDVDPHEKVKLQSGLYRYNTSFLNIIKFYLKGNKGDDDGFVPLKGVLGEYTSSNDEFEGTIDSLKIKYLHQFIRDCKDYGTELFFVISPKFGAESSSLYQPGIRICNEDGYEVWDYYCDSSICENKEFFKDRNHLNSIGADFFTTKVAHRIKTIISNRINK